MAQKKIVIVEDNFDQIYALNILLMAEGYKTAFAVDVVTAIVVIQKERPDLILLDLGLPGGNGYLVMDLLRSTPDLADIPVIVVSARAETTEKMNTIKAGAVYYFEKPFDCEDLLGVISTVLLGAPQLR